MQRDDLIVDKTYKSGRNAGGGIADPVHALLGVSIRGGFRYLGNRQSIETLKLVVITTHLRDQDWPDSIDKERGRLVYFGDNKKPGRLLHETPRGGNEILNNVFSSTVESRVSTSHFPPILVFSHTGVPGEVQFLGLAVPGNPDVPPLEWLTAIWRTTSNERFQNYRAVFTVVHTPIVSRAWIDDIRNGLNVKSQHAPQSWLDWVNKDLRRPLISPTTRKTRTKDEQLPSTVLHKTVLKQVYDRFTDSPTSFEYCAVAIAQLVLPSIIDPRVTPRTADGGRDATGIYQIGQPPSSVSVDFSLEAKCYAPTNAVGVADLSRLISRLRNRQFGILITTSYVGKSAYKEIVEDGHPIVVISGADISSILVDRIGDLERIRSWLDDFDDPRIHIV